MTEPGINARGTAPEDLGSAADQPTAPRGAAATLITAGMLALTTKLISRWTFAGASALVAVGVARVLVRRWRGPLRTGG